MTIKLFFDAGTFDTDVKYLRMNPDQRKKFLHETFGTKAPSEIVSDEAVMRLYTAAGEAGLKRIAAANTIKAPAGLKADDLVYWQQRANDLLGGRPIVTTQ
jgi:hypothetical protein